MKRKSIEILANRIKLLSPSGSKQYSMAETIITNLNDWDKSKLNRWLGYAQCLQVACGEQSLEELREATKLILEDRK